MKNEKFSHREKETIRQIRNSIMHRGRTPSVRELMVSLSYKSPRSVTVIIEQLLSKGVLRRRANRTLQLIKSLNDDEMNARTVDVPLVGTISCGMPMLAEENIEAMIPVSIRLAKPPSRHFLLKAKGDSMDKKDINNGDLVLVRQQTTAENGEIVVALIDDEATIKEFHSSNGVILLKPRSRNRQHKPIILTRDFQIQGVVVTAISNV